MNEITLVEAVRLALERAMQDDDSVLLLGEDVGVDGGVFRATDGLLDRFGAQRVIDTPLSEALFAGLAVGLATQGFKPVVEFQFMGFMYPAIDQVANHASRIRNRTRGRLSASLVLRAPFGGGIRAPEHHSESFEAMFAHIPGIRVVIPSSPSQAYGLLLASVYSPDPVVFLEPKRIYRASKEHVEDDGCPLPLDSCRTLKRGEDITIVTWGAMVLEVEQAADTLAQREITADVIDVVSLKPLDMQSILDSITRTGRCLIVHEAPQAGGVGAEIAASLADEALTSLLAPVRRIAGFDTVMPLPRLESHYMPSASKIVEAATELMEYA